MKFTDWKIIVIVLMSSISLVARVHYKRNKIG
jgi:hypothetical protein